MKILILSALDSSLLTFRLEFLKLLSKRDHQINTLAPSYDDNNRTELLKLGIIPHSFYLKRVSTNLYKEVYSIFSLIKQMLKIDPEVYFGYFTKPCTIGVLVATLCRIPKRYVLIEGLGLYFSKEKSSFFSKRFFIKKILLFLYRCALPLCHKVIFLNQDDLNDLLSYGVKIKKPVVLGGIGVDLDYYYSSKSYPEIPTFLYMGRLLKEKGIYDFLLATSLVKQKYKNVRFVVLGKIDDNPNSLSAQEIERLLVQGEVEWVGFHHDVRPFLLNTTVSVLPSYYREGVPRGLQESLAMSRPIITTDSIGCRETVIDGYNGFLVPIQDPHMLAEKMCQFISSPDLVLSMGSAGRSFAEKHFDAYQFNRRLIELMDL